MSFWDEYAAAEQARADAWLDVAPAYCLWCEETKRGVLLGICLPCFRAWEAARV